MLTTTGIKEVLNQAKKDGLIKPSKSKPYLIKELNEINSILWLLEKHTNGLTANQIKNLSNRFTHSSSCANDSWKINKL